MRKIIIMQQFAAMIAKMFILTIICGALLLVNSPIVAGLTGAVGLISVWFSTFPIKR